MSVGLAVWGAWILWRPDPLREVRAALDRRDFATANDLLAKRLAKHPDDVESQLLAAQSARRSGDFARAFDLLQQYRAKNGANETYNRESALLQAHTGDLLEGERLYTMYSTRPESPDTPFVMEAYLEGSLRILSSSPHDVVLQDGEGPAVVRRLLAASELWLRLRPGQPDQVQGLIWQGRVLRFGREHAKGIAKLREALALDPDHFEARYTLALAIGEDSPEESVRHLEILCSRAPDHRRAHYYLATFHRILGHTAEARRILNEMLVAVPDEMAAMVELALLNMDEGKLDDAERLLQRALVLGPDLPETNIAMSRYQQLAGHPAEAARYRKRFDEIKAAQKRLSAPKQ